MTQNRWGGKWVLLAYICIVSHLSAKNFQNWWKFDEVLTKTNLLSFLGHGVYSWESIGVHYGSTDLMSWIILPLWNSLKCVSSLCRFQTGNKMCANCCTFYWRGQENSESALAFFFFLGGDRQRRSQVGRSLGVQRIAYCIVCPQYEAGMYNGWNAGETSSPFLYEKYALMFSIAYFRFFHC